jgi:hypothetical protein
MEDELRIKNDLEYETVDNPGPVGRFFQRDLCHEPELPQMRPEDRRECGV